jgi:hypothetical protein
MKTPTSCSPNPPLHRADTRPALTVVLNMQRMCQVLVALGLSKKGSWRLRIESFLLSNLKLKLPASPS